MSACLIAFNSCWNVALHFSSTHNGFPLFEGMFYLLKCLQLSFLVLVSSCHVPMQMQQSILLTRTRDHAVTTPDHAGSTSMTTPGGCREGAGQGEGVGGFPRFSRAPPPASERQIF